MSIEKNLPSRENPSPAQSAADATVRSNVSPSGGIENRETSTDSANKEIAKPEQTIPSAGARPKAADNN